MTKKKEPDIHKKRQKKDNFGREYAEKFVARKAEKKIKKIHKKKKQKKNNTNFFPQLKKLCFIFPIKKSRQKMIYEMQKKINEKKRKKRKISRQKNINKKKKMKNYPPHSSHLSILT